MPQKKPRLDRPSRIPDRLRRHLRTVALVAGGLGLLLALLFWYGLVFLLVTKPR